MVFEEIRTAAVVYNSEYVPGTYASNPDEQKFRIYTIHAGDDASNPDWQSWPVAPGWTWMAMVFTIPMLTAPILQATFFRRKK